MTDAMKAPLQAALTREKAESVVTEAMHLAAYDVLRPEVSYSDPRQVGQADWTPSLTHHIVDLILEAALSAGQAESDTKP